MRHFDLTPLYRSTIGFDALASLFDSMAAFDGDTPAYPPYNIERGAENAYRISMAVAGFGEDDINIEVKQNTLTVRAERESEAGERDYLHRGIATRAFARSFQLEDHVAVNGASLVNGLLHIDLTREIPEALKPRTIAIQTNGAKPRAIASKAKS